MARGERTVLGGGARLAQRDECADDHADQDVCECATEIGAHTAQIARMLAQPGDRGFAQLFGVGGHLFDQPRRQRLARAVENFRELLHERGHTTDIGTQHRHDAQDDECDQHDHDHSEHSDREHLAPVVRHAPDAKPWREDVHQLVYEQPGEQRRKQMQQQHGDQPDAREAPGGDLVARSRWGDGLIHIDG